MATKRDYYEVLGVAKSSTADEIKSAYRRSAREYHPDVNKNPGASDKFKEISEAYQVLSEPEKRKAYDQFGHNAFDFASGSTRSNPFGGGFGGFRSYSYGNGSQGADFGGFEDPFDLFEQIFGMGGAGSPFGSYRRRTPTYEMEISFEEAINGTTKDIELTTPDKKQKSMRIKVPAGVDSGTRIRFEGIDIVFRVRRHSEFIREGSDIFSEKNLSIPQIVLGDVVEVNTVSGRINLKVPAGTEPGSLIRIKGKGAPSLRGGRGDHYVRIKLSVPQKLTAEEKKLYEKLSEFPKSKKTWF